MSAFVDTSVLVRYLTGDPPDMLDAARRIVDDVDPLLLTPVVLAETAYVLLSFYQVPRPDVVDALVELLRKRNVRPHGLDRDSAIAALALCRPSGRVSITDALLWAVVRDATAHDPMTVVYTFDARFPSEGIETRNDFPG